MNRASDGPVFGRVDPDLGSGPQWRRDAADESLGLRGVGPLEDDAPLLEKTASCSGVDRGWGEQAETPVAVVVVVSVEEVAAAFEGVVEAVEAIGEAGVVLDRLEVAL